MLKYLFPLGACAACLLLTGCDVSTSPPTPSAPIASDYAGPNTSRGTCNRDGLPPAPTTPPLHPGIAEPNPSLTVGCVNPSLTREVLCSPGFHTSTVRNVSNATRRQVYLEYQIPDHTAPGAYEVDHLIPLEIGGSNDILNLWPEPAAPPPGFHQKDLLENGLKVAVCSGQLTLAAAQAAVASDWWQAYVNICGENASKLGPDGKPVCRTFAGGEE